MKSAILSLHVAWNTNFFPFLCDTFLPSQVTVESMFNQTFLELKSTFLSLYTLRAVNFQRFLSYQSSCNQGEPILCYNKTRQDFDFKQRPSLVYYNKGLARFVTTKAVFAYVISQKRRAAQRKNFRAMFLRRNNAHTPKFRLFRDNFFFHPNHHLAWFCTHPFNYY